VNVLALRAEAADPHAPAGFRYPDTGHWLIQNGLRGEEVVVREAGPFGPSTRSLCSAWPSRSR
jgi:hypothetical protein